MAATAEPTALLSHLHRADGSATFSQNGYTVIGAVNGPIEVQRRDELPEEAVVDVVVRPAAGVGGTRERHLEAILQSTLRQIILIHNFPRTLIQITLQIIGTPENETTGSKLIQASSNLAILPALLQTAVLTLLSASLPLTTTMASVLLAVNSEGGSRNIIPNPTLLEFQSADSVHVLGFTAVGELLVAESEGIFTLSQWDDVYELGQRICCDPANTTTGESMGDEVDRNIMAFLKSSLHDKVARDLAWKD